MYRETIKDSVLTVICMAVPALLFWHAWTVIHYRAPARQAWDVVRIQYALQITDRHKGYKHLVHADKVNELAILRQQAELVRQRLSTLGHDLPPTGTGARIMEKWSRQASRLQHKEQILLDEIDRQFVVAEVDNLCNGLLPLPAVVEPFNAARADLRRVGDLYLSLTMEN